MKDLRRKRLAELLSSSRFNGDRAAFCSSANITKGRLSQLLDPDEAFGDAAAKNLCEALELYSGYFETTSTHPPSTAIATTSRQPVVQDGRTTNLQIYAQDNFGKPCEVGKLIRFLAEALKDVDPVKRDSVASLITALTKSPNDTSLVAALTALMEPLPEQIPKKKAHA